MFPDISPHDWARALDRLVEETLAQAGVVEPPVDALAVAAALGLTVATDVSQLERARYVRLRGAAGREGISNSRAASPSILLRPEPRCERRQWAVAHEIGEHLAYRLFAVLGVDASEAPQAREWAANRFAGRLLLPGVWFGTAGIRCRWDLPRLKRRFATASHELLARRMLEEPAPVIVTICDQGRVGFRAGNLAAPPPRLSEAEQACWRRARQGQAARVSGPSGALVRAWPIHEPGWQREILRTDLPDETDGASGWG